MSIDWSSTPPPLEGAGWSGQPPAGNEEGALAAYLRALRSHLRAVILIFVLILAGAVAYAVERSPTYQATSQIAINPLPQGDTALLGLGLIQDSGDPTTNVETASTLIDTEQTARLTAASLGKRFTAQKVLSEVSVQPQGQSNILDVTANASSPRAAARLANAFATAALSSRSQKLKQAVAQAIAATRGQLTLIKDQGSVAAADLQGNLAQLVPLAEGKDPTISLSQLAVVPRAYSGLSKAEIVLLGLVAAIVLSSAVALLLELLRTPRILTEEQLLAIVPAPVLARIPVLPRWLRRRDARGLRQPLPPGISEALRGVRIQLDLLQGRHRAILITSAFHGDGKTTSAVNLAREISSSGAKVIVVDTDLRKPDQASSFGIEPAVDLPTALESGEPLSFLREVPGAPLIRVLGTWSDEGFDTLDRVARRLGDFLVDALEEANYVILDTPPLGEVTDVLRFIGVVDDILLVSRLGSTTVGSLEVTRELLDRVGRRPTGHLIIGSTPRSAPGYGYYYRAASSPRQRPTQQPGSGRGSDSPNQRETPAVGS